MAKDLRSAALEAFKRGAQGDDTSGADADDAAAGPASNSPASAAAQARTDGSKARRSGTSSGTGRKGKTPRSSAARRTGRKGKGKGKDKGADTRSSSRATASRAPGRPSPAAVPAASGGGKVLQLITLLLVLALTVLTVVLLLQVRALKKDIATQNQRIAELGMGFGTAFQDIAAFSRIKGGVVQHNGKTKAVLVVLDDEGKRIKQTVARPVELE